jgi:Tfp pilus assembly protein PilN
VSDYDNFVVKWLDEISKYIRYYNSIDYEIKINKLYIYGSANLEDNLLQHLTGILNIEVAVLNSISNIELINKEVEKGFNIKIFLTPLLAAFNDKNDIYFQCEKNNMLSTRRIDFLVVVILLLLIAVFNYIIYLKSNEINNKKLFVSDKDNVLLNNEIEILKKDITYLENMARNIEILKETSNNDDFVRSEIFSEIKYAIPQSTQVTSISVDRYSTQLNCNSYSMEEVTLFLEKLRKIGFIESVYIPSMEIKEELNYSYSVVCVLKEVLFIDK